MTAKLCGAENGVDFAYIATLRGFRKSAVIREFKCKEITIKHSKTTRFCTVAISYVTIFCHLISYTIK